MKLKTISFLTLIALGMLATSTAASFENVPGGSIRHTPSGVLFPAQVGLFQREGTRSYDRTGRDASVRYVLDHLVLGDAYIYPVGRPPRHSLDSEFAQQQKAIRQTNRNAKLIAQTAVSTKQGGRLLQGRQATYDLERPLFGNSDAKAGSQFILFRDGPWFVAYRFSYPRERSAIATKHVGNFLAQWWWKGR